MFIPCGDSHGVVPYVMHVNFISNIQHPSVFIQHAPAVCRDSRMINATSANDYTAIPPIEWPMRPEIGLMLVFSAAGSGWSAVSIADLTVSLSPAPFVEGLDTG